MHLLSLLTASVACAFENPPPNVMDVLSFAVTKRVKCMYEPLP